MRTFLIVLIAVSVIGCSKSQPSEQQATATPKSSPTPSQKPDEKKDSFDIVDSVLQEVEVPENRPAVRKATMDYVKEQLPNARVEGISLFAYSGNLYIAGVDLQADKKSVTVNLIVRIFVREDGSTYWKPTLLTPEMGNVLSGYMAQRYKELKRRYDDLSSGEINKREVWA